MGESQQLVTQIPTVNRDTFSKMVKESNVELREGTQTLMKHFSDQKVPVLVLSAGLGDMVVEILVGLEAMQPNMHVVSNFLKYDKEGNILGMKNQLDEIIHVYNKNDKSLNRLGSSGDFVASVASRRNVILVGDSLGDCNMADGVHDPAAILKIGFLNHSVDTDAGKVRLEKYLDAFDIVLVQDRLSQPQRRHGRWQGQAGKVLGRFRHCPRRRPDHECCQRHSSSYRQTVSLVSATLCFQQTHFGSDCETFETTYFLSLLDTTTRLIY